MPATDHALQAVDGVRVRYRRWLPPGEPRGAVQVVHGAPEHLGRYGRLATGLTFRGLAVYAVDLRGHGRTAAGTGAGRSGSRGAAALLADVRAVHRVMEREHPGVPRVLLGHATGSVVALAAAEQDGGDLAGLALSGPAGTASAAGVCDLAVRSATAEAVALLPDGLPVLLLSGRPDPVGGAGTAQVTALAGLLRARGLPVQQHVYPDARHEAVDETDRDEVVADLLDWLDARLRDVGVGT